MVGEQVLLLTHRLRNVYYFVRFFYPSIFFMVFEARRAVRGGFAVCKRRRGGSVALVGDVGLYDGTFKLAVDERVFGVFVLQQMLIDASVGIPY